MSHSVSRPLGMGNMCAREGYVLHCLCLAQSWIARELKFQEGKSNRWDAKMRVLPQKACLDWLDGGPSHRERALNFSTSW